jgi:hypothetical protein
MNAKEIEILVHRFLSRYGALKKGRRWLLENTETVCHVRLEPNRWRPNEYTLPFWVFVRELWTGPKLAEPVWAAPEWHIMGSRYSPQVQEAVELDRCLDLTRELVSGQPRMKRLEELFNEMVIPFLSEIRTVAGIRRAHREGLLRGVGVHRSLQMFLGVFVD